MNELSPADLTVFEGVTIGVPRSRIVKNLVGVAIVWPVSVAITICFWTYVLSNRAGLWRLISYWVYIIVFVAHGAVVFMPYLAFFTLLGMFRRRRYVISRDYLQAVETSGGIDRVFLQVPLRNVAWVGVAPLIGRVPSLFLDVRDLGDEETLLPGWKERTRRQFDHDYHLVAVQCEWGKLVETVNRALGPREPTSA